MHFLDEKRSALVTEAYLEQSRTTNNNNNNNNNNNEFILAYPFYIKLALCPKIIYIQKRNTIQ